MRRPVSFLLVLLGTILILALCPTAPVQAGVLVVAGSPEYDQTTGTGFIQAMMPTNPGSCVNNSGMAVGLANKYSGGTDMGSRAVRWDASGTAAAELDNLGTKSDGTTGAHAVCINNAGTVAGLAIKYVDGIGMGTRAVRWDAGGTAATELGNLGTKSNGITSAHAIALNDVGTVVGQANKYNGDIEIGTRAVRWDAGGTAATELGNLGTDSEGHTYSNAYDVNDTGTAVGRAYRHVGSTHLGYRAVRWDAGGTAATELGNLGTDSEGSTESVAYAINNAGTIVGRARKYVGGVGDRAVRWDAGGTAATELDDLGTDSNGYTDSEARAINNAGTIIGLAIKYIGGTNKGYRAVRWDAGGTAVTELDNLGTSSSGETKTYAYAFNDDGVAVGYAEKYDGGAFVCTRSVIWLPDASVIELNDLDIVPVSEGGTWVLGSPKALSNDGWMAGEGSFDPDGDGPLAKYNRLWVAQVGLGGTWTNTTGGTWGRGLNWSTGTPAMQIGNATFDLAATYTVALDRDEQTNNFFVDAGNVTIDLAGYTLTTEETRIGNTSSGAITLASGTTLNHGNAYVGYNASATGVVSIDGADSTWTHDGRLYVGYHGDGTMEITNGATVNSDFGRLGHYSSTGEATVDGAGSRWTNANNLIVGRDGNGTLTIRNGGVVQNTIGYLAYENNSTSEVTVTGTNSAWVNSDTLYVGYNGYGTLEISAGGTVNDTTGHIGRYATSTSQVTVTGTGSTWSNSGGLSVGREGNGILTISAGGVVSNTWCDVGSKVGSTGTAIVTGSGSTWTNDSLNVGGWELDSGGSGTVTVEHGGMVNVGGILRIWGPGTVQLSDTDSQINTGSFIVESGGTFLHNSGTLTVTGGTFDPGTASYSIDSGWDPTLCLNGSSATLADNLYVGDTQSGMLQISGGGTVTVGSDTYVGSLDGAIGSIRFGSSGGTLTTKSLFASPTQLTGTGTINARGLVSDMDLVFDSTHGLTQTFTLDSLSNQSITLHVDLSGGPSVNGHLGVGYRGNGSLTIRDGITVDSDRGYIGYCMSGTGRVAVEGSGSAWNNSGSLYVGRYGNGTLNISGGGTVSNSYGYIGHEGPIMGKVRVSGVGSTWTNYNHLYVGGTGDGILKIADGGSVAASNVLINEQSTLSIEVSNNSQLIVGSGSGAIHNEGTVYVMAGAAPEAGSVYTPIETGNWAGTGVCKGIGGTWVTASRQFFASAVEQGISGTSVSVDLAAKQRVLFNDSTRGWNIGASFAAETTSTTMDFTATALEGTLLDDLEDLLEDDRTVRGAWEFASAGGYVPGDPIYLSFEVGASQSLADLEVWRHDGAGWAEYDAWDLIYNGNYASFLVDDLDSYAVTVSLRIPGDANGDHRVNEMDAAIVAAHWREPGKARDGDFNGDGMVDATDASIMAANWGDWTEGDGQPNNVPEPGMVVMLLSLGLVVLQRTRKYSSRSA